MVFAVPRKVLRDTYNYPLETDEHNQQEPTYENELDDDDQHYKETEAIPPAPKIQGRIPRTDQKNNTFSSAMGTNDGNLAPDSVLIQNEKRNSNGWFYNSHLFYIKYEILTLYFFHCFQVIITTNYFTFAYFLAQLY